MMARASVLAFVSIALFTLSAGAETVPVLHYPLNEGSGLWAFDSSGNALDAPLESVGPYTAPAWGAGYFGSGLVFDGNSDLLNTGDDDALDLNHYTVMAWVNYEENTQFTQEVLEKADAYWMNIRQTTQRLRAGGFYGSCNSASWFYLDSTLPVEQNTWTHVASTYDGSELRIYLDGELSGSAAVTGTLCSNANPLAIGAKHFPAQGSTNSFFNGMIDDVQIFDHALTEAQVQARMSPPTAVPALSPTSRAFAMLIVLLSGVWLSRRTRRA